MDLNLTLKTLPQWEVFYHAAIRAFEDGVYDESEQHFFSALEEVAKYGANDPRVAMVKSNIAELFATLGKHEEAEEHFKTAITIYEKSLGTDYGGLRRVYESYADLLNKLHRESEAEEKRQKARATQNVTSQIDIVN